MANVNCYRKPFLASPAERRQLIQYVHIENVQWAAFAAALCIHFLTFLRMFSEPSWGNTSCSTSYYWESVSHLLPWCRRSWKPDSTLCLIYIYVCCDTFHSTSQWIPKGKLLNVSMGEWMNRWMWFLSFTFPDLSASKHSSVLNSFSNILWEHS